jgi:hypothetical protein
MAEIKNTFLKGKMNQDLDPRIIPNGEYREARNLSISRSESSTVGEFENVLGNTAISTINASAQTEIIGYFIDNNSNTAYLFATDWDAVDGTIAPSSAECYIVSVDLSAINPPTVLVEGYFLNFNKSFPFFGINLVENLLFFTDNLNQPRKINVINALTSGYYTNEDQISVAKFAPWEPILVMDRNTTTITGAGSGSSVITPASITGIKVGDIVTDNNKVDSQNISDLVVVIGITATSTLLLSSSITVPDGTYIDFSRPTMTNAKDVNMSNKSSGSIQTITGTGTDRLYTIPAFSGGPSGDQFLYDGENGIPRLGDLVTGTGVPANTTVVEVQAIDSTAAGPPVSITQEIIVKLSKETTLIVGDNILIGANPNYDSSWRGDEKFLEDKFIRFSYRFKFEDNEYSLMAPWSQIMFIPKQYSQFGGGLVSPDEDMNDAYKSTIVSWFENNINNILLKIPMEKDSGLNMFSLMKITDVDILYKESDALAVKVLETIPISNKSFSSISFNDPIHGNGNKHFLDYSYSSTKPYKTLPNNQVTRVSDKVPVRALAQEVIGNRVVYGNYRDRHTAPSSIQFRAIIGDKSKSFDNYTQYPFHQLKQNRTYQVGFVLSDRYGRQSDVILSSYDGDSDIAGSTVFNAYNTPTDQDSSSPLTDWLGDSLKVQLDSAINSTKNLTTGAPGLYNAITNPLGWFSYKVVVKQQEQEYYNVYLPGFVNGYPVIGGASERNKSFFTTTLGDNINKIPRDLSEVGPTDKDYTSSELLSVRVNNKLIDNNVVSPKNPFPSNVPWNAQYFPGNSSQEVIQIATVRDMEIQSIPFKPSVPSGEYGESAVLQTYVYNTPGDATSGISTVNEVPEPTGRIPWGTTPANAALYNADTNPFVIKCNQSDQVRNPIGAYVTTFETTTPPGTAQEVYSMAPFLSVAETQPVYSLLDIYWETSLSGELSVINSLIDSQYAGVIGGDFITASFPESASPGDAIGNPFNFQTGGGTDITTGLVVNSISVIDQTSSTPLPSGTFTLEQSSGGATTWEIKTGANQYFFYNTNVAATPSTGVYTMTANVTYNGETDDIILNPFYLSNVQPVITGNPEIQLTGITTGTTTIHSFSAVNGSNPTGGNSTDQIVWSLDPNASNYSTVNNQFEINSSTGVLTVKSSYNLVDSQSYDVAVLATDVNGNGLSGECRVTFTAGTQRVNRALCLGWQGSLPSTGCGDALQVQFLDSSTTTPTFGNTTVTGGGSTVVYGAIPALDTYNVANKATTELFTPTTGKLGQGTLYIEALFTNSGASVGSDFTTKYTVQVKPDSGGGWQQATDTTTNTFIYNVTLNVGTNGTTTGTKHTFTQPGEYRVLTLPVTGEACGTAGEGTTELIFNFGDDNFTDCQNSPA